MKKVIVLFLFALSINVFSQTDSIYNFTLPSMKIKQSEKDKTISYEFDNNYNSFSVTDSFLIASPNKYNYKVRISDLEKVTFIRSSSVLPVMAITFGAGFLLGYGLEGFDFGGGHSVSTGQRILSGLIVGCCLSLVGGAIALLISHDKVYDLPRHGLNTKKKFLIKTFKENKFK